MPISIPPKCSVMQLIGFIKGKSATHVARAYFDREQNPVGQHFLARGCFVHRVGRDEEASLGGSWKQKAEDRRLEQLRSIRGRCHLQVAHGSLVSNPSHCRLARLTSGSACLCWGIGHRSCSLPGKLELDA